VLRNRLSIQFLPGYIEATEVCTLQIGGDDRSAEADGRASADVGRELGVSRLSRHTTYAWKAEYGGMGVSEVQRLRQLEDENHRLKKLVADLSLGKEMLKAVIERTSWSS
jgi:putative transposase